MENKQLIREWARNNDIRDRVYELLDLWCGKESIENLSEREFYFYENFYSDKAIQCIYDEEHLPFEEFFNKYYDEETGNFPCLI